LLIGADTDGQGFSHADGDDDAFSKGEGLDLGLGPKGCFVQGGTVHQKGISRLGNGIGIVLLGHVLPGLGDEDLVGVGTGILPGVVRGLLLAAIGEAKDDKDERE